MHCRAAYSLWSSLPRGPPSPALELPLELLDALPQLVQAPHHHVPVEAAGGATVQATGGALATTSPPLTVVTPIPRSPLSSPLSSPQSSSHPSATPPPPLLLTPSLPLLSLELAMVTIRCSEMRRQCYTKNKSKYWRRPLPRSSLGAAWLSSQRFGRGERLCLN